MATELTTSPLSTSSHGPTRGSDRSGTSSVEVHQTTPGTLVGADVIRPWWHTEATSWDRDASHPASGDFDGDGIAEVASIVDDPSGGLQRLWVLGAGTDVRRLAWTSGEGGPIGASDLRVLAGDFDGDGLDDLVAFGDLAGSRTRVLWFPGSRDGLGEVVPVWDSGPGNWELARTWLVAADIEGDGDDEVVVLYQYDGGVVRLWAMPGTSDGPTTPRERWNSCQSCWEMEHTRLSGGDLDGDGVDEVSMFYDYGGATSRWWAFSGADLADGGFPTAHLLWTSGIGQFDSSRALYADADLEGDGTAEVVALYDYGSAQTRLWSFFLDRSGSAAVRLLYPPLALPWGGGWATGVPITMFQWDHARLV